MKMLIKEKISPHKSKTPEGYLVCRDAILGRTGSQEYHKCEIFNDCADDDATIAVLRDSGEVFSPEAIASFENKPITCEHPDVDVTPDNYKEYAVGFVRDVHQGKVDGEDVLLGNLIITDADIINDIENGIRTELSCGYTCDITDEAQPRQVNIRGNHVALCSQGRAGVAKIVDSLDEREAKLPKLPARLKTRIAREFNRLSGFVHNPNYDVTDFIKSLEEAFVVDGKPLTFTRENIDGWNKMGDGMMRKDYTFSVDGYDNTFLVSLYADPDTYDSTEVNAYFRDAVEEPEKKPDKVIVKDDEIDMTYDTYRGYDIDFINDEFVVVFDGTPAKFSAYDEALKYIDERLERTEAMLRDRAIRDREYSPYFKQEVRKELARKKSEVEDEEAPDDPQVRMKYRQTKNKLLQKLRKFIKEARDE